MCLFLHHKQRGDYFRFQQQQWREEWQQEWLDSLVGSKTNKKVFFRWREREIVGSRMEIVIDV